MYAREHRDGKPRCCFHPGELLVGVCALCLRERLLVLASNQGREAPPPPNASYHNTSVKHPAIVPPKLFALASFLHRPGSRRHRCRRDFNDSHPQSEDSFASLGDGDGRASWGRKSAANSRRKTNLQPGDGEKSVVDEHGGGLRWTKRVGHIFQALRWKPSSKAAGSCHTAAEGAAKERTRWMTSLSRRWWTTATVELPAED